MEYQQLLDIISFWGYPLMFLLMIAEGPIITLAGAFLASIGVFNVFIVLFLSILADTIGDILFYLIGYFGGNSAILKAKRIFKIKKSTLKKLQSNFIKNGAKIILPVKTTTGLCSITFILAGAAKMNFKLFLFYSTLGGIIWSSLIVILGYFFGYAAKEIDKYIQYAGWAVFLLAVLLVTAILFINKNSVKKAEK
ncbi:MAG: DedA family protein [Candidatus Moraniibacteriota bacterium]